MVMRTSNIHKLYAQDFFTLLHLAGLNTQSAVDYFGVSKRTIKNWYQEKPRAPLSVYHCLAIRSGTLGNLDPDWVKFTLKNGKLWLNPDIGFTPSDIIGIQDMHRQIRELKSDLDKPSWIRRVWEFRGYGLTKITVNWEKR